MKLFDATLGTLERSLDVRLARQNVLAGNVANADTPDYLAKDLNFNEAMKAVERAEATNSDTQQVIEQSIDVTQGASVGIDGNSVDLDRTMVAMAENGLQYGAATRAAGKKLAILRYVASDGQG